MSNIINYLNCGRLIEYDDMVDYCVENNKDNIQKIVPGLKKKNEIFFLKPRGVSLQIITY